MSPVRLIILLVAAGAAIAAVFLVRSAQTPAPAAAAIAVEAPKPKEMPTKQILVARAPIPLGKFVVADDLKWQDWPETTPTGAFIDKKDEAEGLEKMVGAVALFDLVEGEPITKTKLIHPGDQSFMAAMLTPGMRAISIEISPETAAGGFILPNDHIDVTVTREIESGNKAAMQNVRSDMILQNIRVLAIDGIYAPPAKEGQAALLVGTRATLELSQQDASLLQTAKKAGELSFTLRSIADIQSPSGATGTGRVYRDGMSGGGADGVRVYRYGTETVTKAPAG